MKFIYNSAIFLYGIAIRIASLFNKKAKLWIRGRKNIFSNIQEKIQPEVPIAWFHTASLGEFEQGKPVIEKFKQRYPEYKILLTFFSPSGFEIRKNYNGADYIFYLPLDTPSNAQKFVEIIKPQIVFFVKYEFWYNYIKQVYTNQIPIFIFSTNFRNNQIFFKWYGIWYKKILQMFTHIFVQTESSKKLLNTVNINNTTIAGDTRFDRVLEISKQSKEFDLVKKFKNKERILIAGSTWEPDHQIIVKYINNTNHNLKFIIAPHEIHPVEILKLKKQIAKKTICYSEATIENVEDADILIIDNVGILSSLYKYAEIAYIGGGFGVGIHNILEAATFGLPIIFGPKYQKFAEACNLIEKKAAFSITTYENFSQTADLLLTNNELLTQTSQISRQFVAENTGATTKILNEIEKHLTSKQNY